MGGGVGIKDKEVDLVEVNPLAYVFVMTELGFLTYLQRGCPQRYTQSWTNGDIY